MDPCWPYFDEEMVDAAARVLRSGKVNYWTGDEGRNFEHEFAQHVGCQYAVALANGTVAIELALYGLGISTGDEVVVPSRTFVATAMAVARVGAVPVFADVDRDSQNVSAETVAAQLSSRTKAVIVVHLAGWPADMDPILELARQRNLAIIEDCAQAHGARYKGRAVGSMGDVGAYSFCQDKIITTGGEGGMLVTNRRDVWTRAWSYKDHGKRASAVAAAVPTGRFRWLHDSLGSNFRLTEMQAAIGRVALRQLPTWLEIRRRNAAQLIAASRNCRALRTPLPPAGTDHAYYKFYTFLRRESAANGPTRDQVLMALRDRGLPSFSGACGEIYRERAFPAKWRPRRPHAIAQELAETSLMFQVDPTWSVERMQSAAQVLVDVMEDASSACHIVRQLQSA